MYLIINKMKATFALATLAASSQASLMTDLTNGLQNFNTGAMEAILLIGEPDPDNFDFSASTCYQVATDLNSCIADWGASENGQGADFFFQCGIKLSVQNEKCNINGLLQYVNQRSSSTPALIGTLTDAVVEGVMGVVYSFTGNTAAWHENIYYDLYIYTVDFDMLLLLRL